MPESLEVLFEFRRIGPVVRASAIDPSTGTEAIVSAPVSTSQADLRRLALRKLTFLLKKGNSATADKKTSGF